MAEVATRPFPWGSLERVRGADAAALQRIHRWALTSATLESLRTSLQTIVGAPIGLRVRNAQRGGPFARIDDGVAVVVAGDSASGAASRVLIEAEGPLASTLVALALRRTPPKVFAATPQASAHLAGAFGAIMISAARGAGTEAPLQVLDAGPSAPLLRSMQTDDPNDPGVDAVTLTVTVGIEAFVARILMPTGRLSALDSPWDRTVLRGLQAAELALSVVASVAVSSVAEIASLVAGDAWIPEVFPFEFSPSTGTWKGPVWLAAPDAEIGIAADLGERHSLVVRGRSTSLSWSLADRETPLDDLSSPAKPLSGPAKPLSGNPMSENETTDALVEALGDAPLIVRVEIGSASLRARDWAALAPGDVIALGRRVTDPVTLRVGGVELARGELVEIDGQVGVRILSRIVHGADGS